MFLFKLQAEHRIVKSFPERIVHLNELLAKPEFSIALKDLKCYIETPTVVKVENNVNK